MMGGSPSLFGAFSFHKWVCVYICGTLFFDMMEDVVNTKFQTLLDLCSDHGHSSFYDMKPNDYS
jgi:hypothetical protein